MLGSDAAYNHLHTRAEFDSIVDDHFLSSDEEDDPVSTGHPTETKTQVLENLAAGFAYNKNGPAREYNWTSSEISQMADLIRSHEIKIRKGFANKPRIIRAQTYTGETSNNLLLRWINSVRSGKRFPSNTLIERGDMIKYNEWSNHRQWEYVSQVLTAEFHYWIDINKRNQELSPQDSEKAQYPLLGDLIFRNNEDFTGGLWSKFYKYWQPFIDELRYSYL